MRTYTDIEQSKKLAEILSVDSADMYWINALNKDKRFHSPYPHFRERLRPEVNGKFIPRYELGKLDVPCWSLAALLEVLPSEISKGEKFVDKYQIDIRKYDGGDGTTWYQIAYGNDRGSSGEWHDMINTGEKENIIDCCYQMIVRLKEKDLL